MISNKKNLKNKLIKKFFNNVSYLSGIVIQNNDDQEKSFEYNF